MNRNILATVVGGVPAMVQPEVMAVADKSITVQLLKLPATDVPALLPDVSDKLAGADCSGQSMARIWKGT